MAGKWHYMTLPKSHVTYHKNKNGAGFYRVKFPQGFKVKIEGQWEDFGGLSFNTGENFVRESKFYEGGRTVSMCDDPEKPFDIHVYQNVMSEVPQEDGTVKEVWDNQIVYNVSIQEVEEGARAWLHENEAVIKVPAESCKHLRDRGYTIVAGPKAEVDGKDLSNAHWYCHVQGRKKFDAKTGTDTICFRTFKGAKIEMYEDVKNKEQGAVAWLTPHDLNRASFEDRRNAAKPEQRTVKTTSIDMNGPATPGQMKFMRQLRDNGSISPDAFAPYPYQTDEHGIPMMSFGEANAFLNAHSDNRLDFKQKEASRPQPRTQSIPGLQEGARPAAAPAAPKRPRPANQDDGQTAHGAASVPPDYVRTDEDEDRARELAERVRERIDEAMKHGDFDLDKFMEGFAQDRARLAQPQQIAMPHAYRPSNWNQDDDQPKRGAR